MDMFQAFHHASFVQEMLNPLLWNPQLVALGSANKNAQRSISEERRISLAR
jgi:hypothetical protein